MKSTIHHFFSFNAKKRNWVNWLNGMTYGGSGKPSQQRKLISLIWFVGGVSWSAHNSLSFNQKKFDWLKRIDCRPASSAFLHPSTKKRFFICWLDCRAGKKRNQSNGAVCIHLRECRSIDWLFFLQLSLISFQTHSFQFKKKGWLVCLPAEPITHFLLQKQQTQSTPKKDKRSAKTAGGSYKSKFGMKFDWISEIKLNDKPAGWPAPAVIKRFSIFYEGGRGNQLINQSTNTSIKLFWLNVEIDCWLWLRGLLRSFLHSLKMNENGSLACLPSLKIKDF